LEGGALGAISRQAAAAKPDLALSEVSLLPPIPNPDKIVCIGLNYRAHIEESGIKAPTFPTVFMRLTNTLVPHNGALVRPSQSTHFDYEGELAIIIGKPGRNVSRADALGHVAGYSCFNDGSLRDYQFEHSLDVGKNFYATGGFGPWLVTSDEVPDPRQLLLCTRVNGEEVQRTRIDDMIFDIPYLVSYVSAFTPLVPGDVIATGTPSGVGFPRKPPLWLKPGDIVEVEVDRIGILKNHVTS
jgi:2-keto-4-pentenoate hydratase/2-oxohepta-3-ene-1,7-dioic acid hydratase in catechol pathway